MGFRLLVNLCSELLLFIWIESTFSLVQRVSFLDPLAELRCLSCMGVESFCLIGTLLVIWFMLWSAAWVLSLLDLFRRTFSERLQDSLLLLLSLFRFISLIIGFLDPLDVSRCGVLFLLPEVFLLLLVFSWIDLGGELMGSRMSTTSWEISEW